MCVAAFEDFLKTYKSTSTEATSALQDLRLDGDANSDEYDFMDDSENEGGGEGRQGRAGQTRGPKLKYMQLLQDVADRVTSHILIELDDLQAVSSQKPSL